MNERNDLSTPALNPEKLQSIQRENPFVRISDAVYNMLEEAILSSQFEAGSKLKINTIAEQLGVSGTPVREAIERLIARGLVVEYVVDGKKYKSYRVFDIDDTDIAELFMARKAIDGIAAYICAEKNWRVDIDRLEQHAAAFRSEMHEYINGRAAWLDAASDRALHMDIVNAAQNKYLSDMYHSIDKKLNYLSVRTCEYLAAARKRDDLLRICSFSRSVTGVPRNVCFPRFTSNQLLIESSPKCPKGGFPMSWSSPEHSRIAQHCSLTDSFTSGSAPLSMSLLKTICPRDFANDDTSSECVSRVRTKSLLSSANTCVLSCRRRNDALLIMRW